MIEGVISHAIAEQGLNSADRPRIATGLNRVGHRKIWIEASRPLRKLRADGEETVESRWTASSSRPSAIEANRRENGNDTALSGVALRVAAPRPLCFAFNGAQSFVVGVLFVRLLLGGLKRGPFSALANEAAGIPLRNSRGDLGLDPRPVVGTLHVKGLRNWAIERFQ